MIETAIHFPATAQNPDGSWGAGGGKRSNTEVTAFALLALRTGGGQVVSKSNDGGLTWLIERQNADGSWPLTDQLDPSSWTTALAALSLSHVETHKQQSLRGADWLLSQAGRDLGWLNPLLMWEALGGDDPAAQCPYCGKAWQYMGTEYHAMPDARQRAPGWYHCFRHRHHPRTQQREYVWILSRAVS